MLQDSSTGLLNHKKAPSLVTLGWTGLLACYSIHICTYQYVVCLSVCMCIWWDTWSQILHPVTACFNWMNTPHFMFIICECCWLASSYYIHSSKYIADSLTRFSWEYEVSYVLPSLYYPPTPISCEFPTEEKGRSGIPLRHGGLAILGSRMWETLV